MKKKERINVESDTREELHFAKEGLEIHFPALTKLLETGNLMEAMVHANAIKKFADRIEKTIAKSLRKNTSMDLL